jgi:EAL domain-containing protein (putative c-di-GMP-specific phosphodiesterase class I)
VPAAAGPRAGPVGRVHPLAEETGLVVELDRFVPRQACLQMAG